MNGIQMSCHFPDFVRVWSSFQSQSRDLLGKHSLDELEVILWTSTLTNAEYIDNLSNKDYTIQIWTDASVSSFWVASGDLFSYFLLNVSVNVS